MKIRDATEGDVGAINRLYNALIPTTTVAWTEELESPEERAAWFAAQTSAGNAVLVAETDGTVVGFASYGDFRNPKWPGYRFTVEHTVHVDQTHVRSGIGGALMAELVTRAAAQGKHVMVGAIDAENVDSIAFHLALGFTEVGRLPETGFKFGRWLDLVLLQRRLV